MNIKIKCIFIWVFYLGSGVAAELRFNKHGQMLAPDQTYLERGLESQGRGHNNDAMRYLKKSARFGNPYAQSAIAFIHMQNNDYVSALAWFNLVDLKMIDKDELITSMIGELGSLMTESNRQLVHELNHQLVDRYGKEASLNHREKWKSGLKIGGTRIKGSIPSGIKIYPVGRIEQNGNGVAEIYVSSIYLTGEDARLQMNEFIYNYEIKFTRGKVKLEEVEYIDKEKLI